MIDRALPLSPADRVGRPADLHAAAQQLRLLAARLESQPAQLSTELVARGDDPAGTDPILQLARALYAARSGRNAHLPGISFGEPSWDMLLTLYVAARQGEELLVSALYSASHAPTSTALRHLKRLRDKHYVEIERHGSDSRKRLVRLAPAGQARLERLLASIAGLFATLPGAGGTPD
jgi:DNA-binding MarR family transcriptional regulator